MVGTHENSDWLENELGAERQIKAAAEYGIDISQLAANVNRSAAERIRRHQIALNTAEQLRRAEKL